MELEKEYLYKYPNESYSGCDMVATITYSWAESIEEGKKRINHETFALGEIQTISYSIHMDKKPVRSIGNVNAKDYTMGPRTIAGSLVFAVFNRHFAKKILGNHNTKFKDGEAFLVDELPPFDIVISFANEYGLRSKLVIYGIRLLNEGQVMSINDVFTENTYQFFATDLEYLNTDNSYMARTNGQALFKIKDKASENKNKNSQVQEAIKDNTVIATNSNDKFEEIILSVTSTNQSRYSSGKAILSLNPVQTNGEIKIKNESGDAYKISVDGSPNYSISLPVGFYIAKFSKNSSSTWKCNDVSFNIKKFNDKLKSRNYAPVVEKYSDTSLTLYVNEPNHNFIAIKNNSDEQYALHEVVNNNRRITIEDLNPNTEYQLYSCSNQEDNKTKSVIIKIKTYKNKEDRVNFYKKQVEYNIGILNNKNLKVYYDILDIAQEKLNKNKNFSSVAEAVVEVKKDCEKELKKLDKEAADYGEEYVRLTTIIFVCNELLTIVLKINNNDILITNKNVEVKAPELFLDSSSDTCFKFEPETDKAEFFKTIKGVNQFASTINSHFFSTIEDNENSVRYNGKSGIDHYVQSIKDNYRSPKVEFYSMTIKEKNEMLKNKNPLINDDNLLKVKNTICGQYDFTSENEIDRAVMRKIKEIDHPKILDPQIEKIEDDNIEIKTCLNGLDNFINENFYLNISNSNDLINNYHIYKKEFKLKDECIKLDNVMYGIVPNKNYAVWIEDKNFNQISNVSTFTNNVDYVDSSEILEYENNKLIKNILELLTDYLPSKNYEELKSELYYNQNINKINVIDKTISYLIFCGIGHFNIIGAIRSLNRFIGTFANSNFELTDIKYDFNSLEFGSIENSKVLIYNIYEDEIIKSSSDSFKINLNDSSDHVLILTISEDLSNKSNIIYLNKNRNSVEVI